MPRNIINTAFLIKTETTPETDAVPTGANNAVLLCDISVTPLDIKYIPRKLIRAFMGISEQLPSFVTVKASITFELAAGGTAGTAPPWAPLVLCCGTAEATLASPARTEYSLVSTGFKTVTGYYYDDGVLHKIVGGLGNLKIDAPAGGIATATVDLIGLDGGINAATTPALTLTAWKKPVAIKSGNVVDVTFGCNYTAGALAGGTTYNSAGVSIDLGNEVSLTELIDESVDLYDRDVKGNTKLDLTAAQEAGLYNDVKSGVVNSFGFTIGTTAGNKIILYSAGMQLMNPKKETLGKRRVIGFEMNFVPTGSGNNEMLIALP